MEGTAGRVEQLEGQLRELAGIVSELAAGPDRPDAVRSWLTMDDPELGADLLTMLVRWLGEVWVQFPGHAGERALPPCWTRHPWLVEELWAARGAWRDAVGPRGSYGRLADWHDRVRPGLARRIAEHLGTCDTHKHGSGPTAEQRQRASVEASDLDAVATAWTADRGIPPTSPASAR